MSATVHKIITDYSNLAESELDTTASAGIKGTTGNASFTFTNNELTNATAAQTAYHNSLSAVATGTSVSVTTKNDQRDILLSTLSILCGTINILAKNDLAKLKSTGFTLSKEGSTVTMGPVEGFTVARGAVGVIILAAKKPSYHTHGIVFAYWDPAYGVAPASPDDWFHRFVTGHDLHLKKLKIGATYQFAAAYKGSDDQDLVWTTPVSKTVTAD